MKHAYVRASFWRIQKLGLVLLAVGILLAAVPALAATTKSKGSKSRNSIKVPSWPINRPTSGTLCTTGTLPNHGNRPTTATLNTTGTLQRAKRFEILWLESNIVLHNRMIKLAKAESDKTTSTTFKTFSLDLQTSLGLEVTQMKSWLKSWYAIDFTTRTMPVANSRVPSGNFARNADLVFLDQVVCYERATIASAKMIKLVALHDELKTFADQLITEGQDVLELVKSWQELLVKMDMEGLMNNGKWPNWLH